MFLIHPTPQTWCYLDTIFLFDQIPSGYPFSERCIIVSVKARCGYDLEFQVLTERGVLRDKLPVSALEAAQTPPLIEQEKLQRWSCPSDYLTVVQLPLGTGKFISDGSQFVYHWTVDFHHCGAELDLGDSQIPEEHKCMHFIECVETQRFYLMPNNCLLFDHSTLVTKQMKSNPGYKVAKKDYSVERFRNNNMNDDTLQFYDIGENP